MSIVRKWFLLGSCFIRELIWLESECTDWWKIKKQAQAAEIFKWRHPPRGYEWYCTSSGAICCSHTNPWRHYGYSAWLQLGGKSDPIHGQIKMFYNLSSKQNTYLWCRPLETYKRSPSFRFLQVWNLTKYCTCVHFEVHVLYLSSSIFCSFILILQYISEGNINLQNVISLLNMTHYYRLKYQRF